MTQILRKDLRTIKCINNMSALCKKIKRRKRRFNKAQ